MKTIFITGTGTDIGKTFVASNLARQLRERGDAVQVLKPVITGWQEYGGNDTEKLLEAVGLEPTMTNVEKCSPWRFYAPLSADIAAKKENKVIKFTEVVKFCKQKFDGIKIIEGAGGLMSPLCEGKTFLDLMEAVGGDVVLVTGTYLGSISHTLTALKTLEKHNVQVILNETPGSSVDMEELADSLSAFINAPLAMLKRGAPDDENLTWLVDN